jgi:hypothetical protein
MIEETGATFVGASVIVDQLPDEVRGRLSGLTALLDGRFVDHAVYGLLSGD